MMSTRLERSTFTWPAIVALIGVLLAALLLVYGTVRFSAGHGAIAFASYAALTTYGAVAVWSLRATSPRQTLPFEVGGIAGLTIGGIAVMNHVVELWVSLPSWAGALLGAGMWGMMFFAFGVACSVTLSRGGSVTAAVLSSVWTAMVMAIVLVTTALGIGFLSMPRMERILAEPFAASGMTDARSFVALHLTSAASEHLFVAPTIAAVVGGLSALVFSLLRHLRRRTALVFALGAAALLIGGVMSIKHASMIARSDRPPYIQFGLAAIAVTLVSAHPLMIVIRRGRRISESPMTMRVG